MNLYQKFSTNPDAETAGVWVNYGDGLEIKLRRAGGRNKKFADALDAVTRRNKRRIDLGSLPEDEAKRIMAEIYADAVVVEWKGVTGPDGVEIAFTRENVVKVFLDLPEFFRTVQADASAVELFRDDPLEADAKN